MIKKKNLSGTFAYLDNITVCEADQLMHDLNVKKLREAAAKYNLTSNENKTISSFSTIQLLGHCIEYGKSKPDASRLQPLRDLKAPENAKALK